MSDETRTEAGTEEPSVLERHAAAATFALLCLLAAVVFRSFLFGDDLYLFRDIGSDTVNLFYPRWVHIADYLRSEGLPGWSFSQGMGQDIRPFALGDPFTWILYACGSSNIAPAIVYVEAAKIVAAGMLFFAYLRVMACRPFTASVGAVLFAFSSFMVVGGAWYVFSSRGVAFALLLLAFESRLMRRRWWLFPVAIAMVAASNVAALLPFAVLLTPYAIARFIEKNGWETRAAARFFGELTWLAILGLLLSAYFSGSILLNLMESPRATEEWTASGRMLAVTPFTFELPSHYFTVIARAFSSDLLQIGDDYGGWYNYLEAPLFYCGLATLLLFALSFDVLEGRRRLLCGAFAGFALLTTVFPYLRIAGWGFSGNYYREFSLLTVLALLYPALRTLDALIRGARPRPGAVALGLGVWLALLLGAVLLTDSVEFDLPLVAIVAVLLLGYAALAAFSRDPHRRRIAGAAFFLLVCVEAAWSASHSLAPRAVFQKGEWSQKTGYNDDSVEALEHIRSIDSGFYRVEKDVGASPAGVNSRNDSKVQGYFGTTSYYSFNQINYIRFLAEFDFIDRHVETQTRWAPGLRGVLPTEGLLAVKYDLFREPPDELRLRGLKRLGRFGEIDLYRNEFFVPLGFVVERWAPTGDLAGMHAADKRTALGLAAFFDEPVPRQISDTLEPAPPEKLVEIISKFSLEWALESAARLRGRALQIESFSHNEIRGRITSKRAGVLVFAVPFDRGWRAELDGEAVRLHRVDVGLTGLLLPAGEHTVSLRYVPPFGRATAAASLAGLALYVLLLIRGRPGRLGRPDS